MLTNNKGFTLIEIIVTIAILSIVIVPLSSMFIQAAKMNSMAAEEYDATLIAQKYFEEIKSIKSDIDAASLNYIFDANNDSFSKDSIDGKFTIAINMVAVAGTQNLNNDDSEQALIDGNNMKISFNEENTIMTVVSSKDSLTESNVGISKTFSINNNTPSQYELYCNGNNLEFKGSSMQSTGIIDTSDFSQYNIAIIMSSDLNMNVYNKIDGTAVKITAIKLAGDTHNFNLVGKEGIVEQKVNVIQGNIESLSKSILYDVSIVVKRNGNEVTTFVGKKAFTK